MMGTVAQFVGHKLHGGWQHAEPDECFMCAGGLAYCTICCGAEASLPTCCPGRPITDDEQDAIVSGVLDFVLPGVWVRLL